ncbi:MAG: YitT family protein [Clostridia bacterium]|nr:YitT family protein [Clostridia bacterium]
MQNKWIQYPTLTLSASLSAVNYAIFVFPNSFAPAGIDGICTMIQDLSGISIGYLSLLMNLPLLLCAFFVLSRDFAVKTSLYVLVFSVTSVLLHHLNLSSFYYITGTGTSIVLAPIVAGVIRGLLYYVTLKLNGSGGGTDIVAALIKHKKPHLDLMHVIFIVNLLIALCSYFVYGMNIEPVICSILYSFVTTIIRNSLQSTATESVKFEIITPKAQQLCQSLSEQFHLSATIINAKGSYSGLSTQMVVCVVNKKNVPYVEDILLNSEDCVVFKSTVGNTLSGLSYK